MRKILFSVFTGVVILIGCSKSSDSPASIVGTWNANKIVQLEYTNNVQTGGDTTTSGTLTFRSDGTYIATDNTGSDTSTYNYNASTKQLDLVADGDTEKISVTNLTSSDLHLNYSDTASTLGVLFKVTVDADYKR